MIKLSLFGCSRGVVNPEDSGVSEECVGCSMQVKEFDERLAMDVYSCSLDPAPSEAKT